MLGNIWTWAGSYRTTQTSIGVEANKIQHKPYQLMDDLKTWTEFWDYKEADKGDLNRLAKFIFPQA